MPKRVFVPNRLIGDAERIFTEAGVEVAYGLPAELRGLGGSPELQQQRREAFEAALAEHLAGAHALQAIGLGAQLPVTAELLDSAPRLEVVFVPSAGVDVIDVAAATERGVAVVNAAGNNYSSVAEHAVGLMLSLTRLIARTDRSAHADGRQVSTLSLGLTPGLVRGKTVGVIGFGFIGREVARICTAGFGMRALAYDPFANPIEAERLGVELVDDLADLMARSDVVSVHSPLTAATRNLVGAEQLAAMKPSALLLNTSRGGTVDTDALVAALQEGRIAGAGLDVTEPEPLPEGHPLYSLDNVVLTPHSAGNAPESAARAGSMSATDVVRALRGDRPTNLVNPDVWPAVTARQAAAAQATTSTGASA
ncbi:NAD(P)-dependent oxidoreductase [Trujillonella endophytica]|uniref:D-3-phosphoglycerate dehydrogenase n=1 Tax=Trujillonella endophytica TaxID=673521 RepID=A0A1H8SVN7_9ACTN|nr:hydroxyacid dehydrogenase [Trujillella endophytica]SEO82546.1 D-3-phosphoglycerate dehydrogenase [Trujillella endophytica]